MSVTVFASLGPRFVTRIVYVAGKPGVMLVGPILVIFKSLLEMIVVGSLLESFVVFAWPPPETLAVFVRLEPIEFRAAVCATSTVIRIGA